LVFGKYSIARSSIGVSIAIVYRIKVTTNSVARAADRRRMRKLSIQIPFCVDSIVIAQNYNPVLVNIYNIDNLKVQ